MTIQRPRVLTVWLFLAVVFLLPTRVSSLQSTNYKIDEDAIGTGTMLQSNSANYRAIDGINDLAVGESSSSSYQIIAGSKTVADPYLKFIINSANANLAALRPNRRTL